MITKDQAMRLKKGDYVWHVVRMAEPTAREVLRLKINGKCRTLVIFKSRWRLPYVKNLTEYGTFGTAPGKCNFIPAWKVFLTEQEALDAIMLHDIETKLKE